MHTSSRISGNTGTRSALKGAIRLSCLATTLMLVSLPLAAQRWNVGLATGRTLIQAEASGDIETLPTILLIGGLDGNAASTDRVVQALDAHRSGEVGPEVALIVIPNANPEASPMVFPPVGTAYRENAESHALWRWIGVHAPDLILVPGSSDYGLIEALNSESVVGVGTIRARRLEASESIADALADVPNRSEARSELLERLSRTPLEVAGQLAAVYGQDFNQLTYIPGMALIGRLRLGEVEDVGRLAAPYLEAGPEIRSSLNIAGHLVFAELAERTNDPRYLDLVRRAADLAFDENGAPLEAVPYHGEMSDAFFMAGPLLARAGRLTGETRYYDMVARHFAFMDNLVLRSDGLYRHSPLTDAAWSRGNAFPALGMALTLSELPPGHPAFSALLTSFRQHVSRLAEYQDRDGMWHEVIDHPGAYAELSSTAMIATAMLRGIRSGWLDEGEFSPLVEAAWLAVLTRTSSSGVLIDVCESTNKQASLEAYLDREAILGMDPRGGGMILTFATEMADLQ